MSGSESLVPFVTSSQEDSKPLIIVDSREASSAAKIVKGLIEKGAKIKIQSLSKGDYIISDLCAIERKTVQDFVYTLTRRHLFDQVFGLKGLYQTPIMLLEGYMPIIYKFSSVNPSAVWGALFALVRRGIALIHTTNQKETIEFLFTSARQEQLIEKRRPAIHTTKKTETIADAQLYFISSLPNIGPEKALSILNQYKTPINALINVDGWNKDVHGLGPIISERTSKILNTRFNHLVT
jgi:ERCC4-type nuclease